MQFKIEIDYDTDRPMQMDVKLPLQAKAVAALMLGKAIEGLAGEMEKETLQMALGLSGGRKPKMLESR